MTRASSVRELLFALDRLGVRAGRIDLADVWPVVAAWWLTPLSDLTGSEEGDFAFLLSLAPAIHDDRATIFTGRPPAAIAGRELVRLDFERALRGRVDGGGRVGISGGAYVSFWYGYDAAWKRLRERSDWIELGISTPQIDAYSDGHPGKLIRYVEEESGVLGAAAEHRALALVVLDSEGDEQLLVVGDAS